MRRMFEGSQFSGNISNWNVRKVKSMEDMFKGSNNSNNIPKWWSAASK